MSDHNVKSLSGRDVFHHDTPTGDPACPRESSGAYAEEIHAHVERWVGPVFDVWTERRPEYVRLRVLLVPPMPHRPVTTLVTSGMSDRPMEVEPEFEGCDRVELCMTLPPFWKLSRRAVRRPRNRWPGDLLLQLARFPHMFRTWLWYGAAVDNGEPYDASTALRAALIAPSPTLPLDFALLDAADGARIGLFAVIPLYTEELALKMNRGVDALLDLFDRRGVTDVVEPDRPNAATGPD